MSRNYDIIHFIQNQMSDMDDKIVNIVTRMFNRIDERKSYASALSTSVSLFIAMKYIQLEPKLILGTIQFQGLSYPHAWLELNDKIFDLATYEDIQHHPVLKDRDLAIINPILNVDYEDASSQIMYYPYQFGETWPMANMKRLVGKTFEAYAEESPMFDILADVCYILEISETPANLDILKNIAKLEIIRDEDAISYEKSQS
jgi:hypothetical protein